VIVVALSLAACTGGTPSWTKQGATAGQLERDRDECLARSQDYLATGESKANYAALDACMTQKGYVVSNPR
jgi:hypothetical protein